MFYLKLSITSLLFVTLYGLVSCSTENISAQENNEQLDKTVEEVLKNDTNTRSGRTLFQRPRTPAFTLRRRQPIKIRARADHFPLRTQMRRVHNNPPNGQPQQQNMRFGYEPLKSSKYLPSSKGANAQFSNNAKGSLYRPQLVGGHPNSIHVPALSQQYMHNFKASPAFNGQVVIHPAAQTQKQQSTTAQQDNSYPKYVKPQQQPATAVASSPPQTQHQQQQQQQQQQHKQQAWTQYPDFQQHPIPDQDKMQQYNEQHEKYLQQQKFLTPKNPMAYYQRQHNQQQHQESQAQQQPQQNYAVQQPPQYLLQSQQQQQQQQHQQQQPSIPIHETVQKNNIHNSAFPAAASVPPKMYSVYEENDMTDLPVNNYQTATNQGLDQEAQEYLRFMNTDEYFLPKKEPNYKKIDDETDKRQYNALKAQAQQHLSSIQQSQAPSPYQPSVPQSKAYQQHVYTPPSSSQGSQNANSLYTEVSDMPTYNQGNPVSRRFYQQDPSTAPSASATVVRTSYQAGYNQNQFVLNSKDNKIGKYTIPPTATTSTFATSSTQSPVLYPQLRHNTAGNRTPEPLRFEFTERDAMVGGYAYTHAPQGQLRYKESSSNSVTRVVPSLESSTTVSGKTQNYLSGKHTIKPVVEEAEDDPEDGDDMQDAGANLFGRQPVVSSNSNANKAPISTESPPSEQKDTEEYCERICAIVEDENEEIVCGSDGYMYTSEAQMECYASCLHIDVTIQGKGSCSTR